MVEQLVECIPNFSEGRDQHLIEQITNAINSLSDIRILSVEMGADANRTVVTFIGPPAAVKEAAFRAIRKATELIDMRRHQGAHPRLGATDVCPLVPLSGITMDECVGLAKELGQRVGEELGIPVFLYEAAATTPERRNLANIRAGEYEALPRKLRIPKWQPDYGPAEFNPKSGATVIGAREFLIAYNITFNTRDKQRVADIALELREKGRTVRTGDIKPLYMRGDPLNYRKNYYPCGSCDYVAENFEKTRAHCQYKHGYDIEELLIEHGIDPQDPVGHPVKKPGRFKHVRAMAWYMEEYGRAQISMNLTDYRITSLQAVLEATRQMAAERGLVVTGSEIVGLVPFDAIYEAGKYYLKKQGKSTAQPMKDIIDMAIYSMGLQDVAPFNPQEKILGLPQIPHHALIAMKTADLVQEVSRDTPMPGGGSIAALAGSLGAALTAMIGNLTIGKKGYETIEQEMLAIVDKSQHIKEALLRAVDEEAEAFNAYLEATRQPQDTPEENRHHQQVVQEGLPKSVQVSMNTAKLCHEALKLSAKAAVRGNIGKISDAAIAGQLAFAGIIGGILNVLTNLPEIQDEQLKKTLSSTCRELEAEARNKLEITLKRLKDKLPGERTTGGSSL